MENQNKILVGILVFSVVSSLVISISLANGMYKNQMKLAASQMKLEKEIEKLKTQLVQETKKVEVPLPPPIEEKVVEVPPAFEHEYTNLPHEMTKYTNKTLGFSFVYPSSYGPLKFDQFFGEDYSGKRGEGFMATFEKKPNIEFGGVTLDFAAGREGWLLDTTGYIKEGNTFQFKFVQGTPVDFDRRQIKKEFPTKNSKVLMIQGFDGGDLSATNLSPGEIGAVLNLSKSKYTGMAFISQEENEFEKSDLYSIVKTMEIVK